MIEALRGVAPAERRTRAVCGAVAAKVKEGVHGLVAQAIRLLPAWALSLAISGCAFVRNIPAVSTPVRTARYYQVQDMANYAAGAVADQGLMLVIHGPQRCSPARICGDWAPVARVGIVTTLGLARRQLDAGYRESGAFDNLFGATASELITLFLRAVLGRLRP